MPVPGPVQQLAWAAGRGSEVARCERRMLAAVKRDREWARASFPAHMATITAVVAMATKANAGTWAADEPASVPSSGFPAALVGGSFACCVFSAVEVVVI